MYTQTKQYLLLIKIFTNNSYKLNVRIFVQNKKKVNHYKIIL